MALPSISFIKGQGGLGRPLPGQDFVSALLFYTDNLPSGFSSAARMKALYALSDAVNAGITNDSSDETPATATYQLTAGAYTNIAATGTATITAIGSDGDTIIVLAGAINLSGTVSKTSSETTATLLAVKVKNAINTGTGSHGYSATNSGAVITITAPIADGASSNVVNINVTATGGITTTTVSFSGGAYGVSGDTVKLTVTEPNEVSIIIGSYKKKSTDTTTALIAQGLSAAINEGTISHGYSASVASSTITITAKPGLGIFLEGGTNIAAAVSAGSLIAGTLTQFTGAVASELNTFHYHISEFFRMQPKGVLFVGFFAVPNTYDYTEITTIQNFSNGSIRQVGIMKGLESAFSHNDLTLIHDVVELNDVAHKPLSALYAADLSGTTDISTLSDLAVLSASAVSAIIAQDGGGKGNYLWQTTGKSVPAIGTLLGTVALAKVSESIAWVGQFNISNGSECEVLAFANGQLFSDVTVTDGLQEALNTKRYIFLKKFVGLSGSWFNDSHTAIVQTSDYAYIENNRTIDKAIRGIYSSLLPSLNSPLLLNSDGTLADTTVAFFESQSGVNLDQMVRDTEISAYQVVVNPSQNVLSTSKIIVAVTLVINGVARFIEVPIGFAPKIS